MELLLVSLVKASLILALAQLLVLALPALSAKCYRYLAIGVACPSGIECTGEAVAFTAGGK